ncbi:MAG TPA: HDIG domain-containing protein [archaeon]|nr:HDIG domain-containing protein [archaeon]
MKLPSLEECESLMEEFNVPENIRKHTEAVRGVANSLAMRIKNQKIKVDAEAVDRAAFLHDLMKMHCIKNNCSHAKAAKGILVQRGYSELGEIVLLHGLEGILRFDKNTSLEAKIIWYADKRVTHDQLVSLSGRYEYLKERYGSISKKKLAQILATREAGFALEKELLSLAGIGQNEAF